MEDLDGEVLASLTEDLLVLLLDDLARAVVGVDDVVTELELDVLHLADDFKVLQELLFSGVGDGSVLLGVRQALASRASVSMSRSVGSGPRG
jgi:hypothetical protein